MRTREEEKIIEEDKAKNPECGYSTSYSKSCRNLNGNLTCETIRRILRSCPNSAPVEVFSQTESTNENSTDASRHQMESPAFPNPFFGKHPMEQEDDFFGQSSNPFSLFRQFLRPFQDIFGDDDFFSSLPRPEDAPSGNGNGNVYRDRSNENSVPLPAPHKFPRGKYPPFGNKTDKTEIHGKVEEV